MTPTWRTCVILRCGPLPLNGATILTSARFVPLDQLSMSPQCGFASTVEGNDMTEADQWAKLELVVRTAARIWN